MAKAKKLPSGSWRAQVYSYTDANGKKHRESFTAPTKAEAEMKAAEYVAHKKRRIRSDLTVGDAVQGYIAAKEGVLSPSTIRGYVRMQKNIAPLNSKRIHNLTSEDMQLFVSDLSRELSPKTVRNVYGLLTASIALYNPDSHYKVTLPAKQKKRSVSPSDDEIQALYKAAYPTLRLCVSLAMCGLRRGEICALEYSDIRDNIAHIHADMIKDKNGKWIIKPRPKTADSDRYVLLPPFVMDQIGTGKGRIIKINPNTVTKQFDKYREKLGCSFTFHGIRRYYASTAAVLGIPDLYVADMGGWGRGSSALKTVYQNNIPSMSEHYRKLLNEHLGKVIGSG
jgi:integrase